MGKVTHEDLAKLAEQASKAGQHDTESVLLIAAASDALGVMDEFCDYVREFGDWLRLLHAATKQEMQFSVLDN